MACFRYPVLHPSDDSRGLPWGELGLAAAGSVVLAIGAAWFVVRMLATFRSRGYISRHM